eukprot:TRINITY_DN28037_c0_g1_i1.p1 TRINITY_DN28037_c0_g1~~TRINITY_DN28037_c0_g1_i1.p1  ORF type:complete len:339 (-),score=62.22 TRINITY_DN28037_c0_g1_i1:60-1010(-)
MFGKSPRKHHHHHQRRDHQQDIELDYITSKFAQQDGNGDLEPLLPNEEGPSHSVLAAAAPKTASPPPIPSGLLEVASMRCIHCNLYFTQQDLHHCRYHPGHFKLSYNSPSVGGVSLVYWSCCKSTVRDQIGCRSGTHQPDPAMNNIGIHFVTDPQPQPQPHQHQPLPHLPNQPGTPSQVAQQQPGPGDSKTDSPFIKHKVMDTDTLVGLSFRYGVPAKTIRQVNRMPTTDLKAYVYLNIPRVPHVVPKQTVDPEAVERNRLHRKLREETGMSKEETTYYLSLHGYSYEEALNEFKMDKAWEKNGIPKNQPLSKKVK